MRTPKAVLLVLLVFGPLGLGLLSALPAGAASSGSSISASVTQSYNADNSVQVGMIVKLKDKDPSSVEPLTADKIQAMLGVVVPTDTAAIVLTPQTVTHQQVLVATSGHYSVLVSNQGGAIKTGDYVTISALTGVGMKASENQTEVIGKAAGNFDGTANVIGTVTLKDQVGHSSQVSLGQVPVDMAISHNPLYQKAADYVPGFLAKAAQTIASKPVSVARIYLCTTLLAITAIVTGSMLYGGVHSGMIAVGRNPLSKKSIIRSLIQTVIAGLIIFIAGIFAVYLLLKL